MTKNISRFFLGLSVLINGFRVIRTVPGLIWWSVIPFALDIILLVMGLSWGWSLVSGWVGAAVAFVVSDPSSWLYWLLYYPLFILFGLGYFVLLIYGIFVVATIIASPFNSIIAEKVLQHHGVLKERPFHFGQWVKTSLRMLRVSLVRGVLFFIVGLVIFVISFIPGLNLVGSFCALLIVALDSADYGFEALNLSLSQRLGFFRQHLAEFAGFASVLGLTLLIPGLTVLMLPCSVAGAAALIAQTRSP